MTAPAALDTTAIAGICRRLGVARLRLFGSALDDRFDPATSDIDFLVDFRPTVDAGIGPYLELKGALEASTGRRVDLIESSAIQNPYFARRVFSEAVDIYEP
jgi:predicted nucleotidyltransferase